MIKTFRPAIFCVLLAMILALAGTSALAADTIKAKEIEETLNYESDTLKIQIDRWHYTYNKHDLRFFVVDIQATRPDQLQTAFAYEEYTKNRSEATSDIAKRHDAVLAINGDYYNYKDDYGLVIRNGVLYRDKASTRDQLLVLADGSFRSIPRGTYEKDTGEIYLNEGAVQSFAFGPLLVDNGELAELPENRTYIIYTADSIREPRTSIGWVDGYHYIIVIADGRRDNWSDKGMSLQELQEIYLELGATVAYNLDGGGSTTLYFNGEKLNKTSGSRERDVSDIIYFTD